MKDDESAGEYAHRTAKPQSLKASVSFGTFPFSSPIISQISALCLQLNIAFMSLQTCFGLLLLLHYGLKPQNEPRAKRIPEKY